MTGTAAKSATYFTGPPPEAPGAASAHCGSYGAYVAEQRRLVRTVSITTRGGVRNESPETRWARIFLDRGITRRILLGGVAGVAAIAGLDGVGSTARASVPFRVWNGIVGSPNLAPYGMPKRQVVYESALVTTLPSTQA